MCNLFLICSALNAEHVPATLMRKFLLLCLPFHNHSVKTAMHSARPQLVTSTCAGQFRFLEQLLLVHGRWSYLRITSMVAFFFYKNLLFGLTIFLYNIFCLFSGQILYDGAS